jgi:hypothetical protein
MTRDRRRPIRRSLGIAASQRGILVTPHQTQEDDHGHASAKNTLNAATRAVKRASLSARSHRYGQNMFCRSVPDCRWRGGRETWQCSIWQSTASCGAAISSHFGSRNVAPSGYAVDRATVRQKKMGRPVRFELTEQTRQAVDDYIKAAGKKSGRFLFNSMVVVTATAA